MRNKKKLVEVVELCKFNLCKIVIWRIYLALYAKIVDQFVNPQNNFALEQERKGAVRAVSGTVRKWVGMLKGLETALKNSRELKSKALTLLSVMFAPRASADMSHRLSLLQLRD